MSEPRTHSLAIQPFGEAQPVQDADPFGVLMAAAELVQFRRLLVDIDL